MRRIRLKIEYDGTEYSGWQRQSNAMTVQQAVEEALFAVTGENTCVTGAGRTDAGVHAYGQVAHFDTKSGIPAEKFSFALNTKLPRDIRIISSEEAPADFHSTLHAKKKHYRYVIYNAQHAPALDRDRSAHVFYTLDIDKMKAEAACFVGEHDFAAFQSVGTQIRTTVRTIYSAEVSEQPAMNGRMVYFDVWGSGFLYNMVRIMAGTLIDVGTGKLAEGAASRALESKKREDAGVTAPPQGLYMMEIIYE